MGELVVLQNKSHYKDLCDGLCELLKDSYKTDVTVSFQENGISKVVDFHHLILAIFSPNFRDYDSLGFIFNEDSGFTDDDVAKVIEFMYVGQIQVTIDSLPRLKMAAESMAAEKLSLLLQQRESGINSDSNVESEKFAAENYDSTVNYQVTCEQSSPNASGTSKNEVEIRITKQSLSDFTLQHESNDSNFQSEEIDAENFDSAVHYKVIYEKLNSPLHASKLSKSEDETKQNDFTSDHNYEDVGSKIKTRKSKRILKNKNVDKNDGAQVEIISCKRLVVKKTKKNEKQAHRCPQCSYETDKPFQLRCHLASIHQMDEEGNVLPKCFQCNECEYVCASKVQLRKHKFNKHSVRKHVCSECGYATVNKTTLRIHFNGKHGSVKTNKCKYCDYTSRYKSTLYLHMETHTRERPICEVCGKTFLTPAYLKAHQITHSTEPKPFSCHLCKFTSLSRYRLKMHHHKVHKNVFSSTEEFVNWYQQFQNKVT